MARVRPVIAATSAVLVGVALAAVAPASAPAPAAADVPAGGMTAAQVNSMFGSYGDAGGHWTGGDSTVSVLLPDGRVAWLFSDTYLGTVNDDGTRPDDSPMVNNTIVVQDGTSLVATLHGGSATWPEAMVKPSAEDEFFWVADGIVESGTLKVLYNRYRRFGGEVLDVELVGTSLATFALPDLTLSSVVDMPVGTSIQWGSALLVDGSHTYVYGTSSGLAGLKYGHVARAPVGDLGGAWQFWTGTSWSGSESAAARLLSGVGNAFGVQKLGGQYVFVTQDANLLFDPQLVAYTAPAPTGPFSGPVQLLTAPEQEPGTQKIVYAARLHPDLARPGKVLMSYDVNSLDPADNYADARLYRPRFVELDWPRPQPEPGTLPAAPTGVTATPDSTGKISLRWAAVDGAAGYYVHRRDVTGGQTHFSRQRQRVTQATTDIDGLITGHRYELKVTAANAAGEGPFSATVAATSRIVRDASVIRLANTPDAVSGVYIVRLKDNPAVRGRGVEATARELLQQVGGSLDRLFPLTLNGFSANLTEPQAIDLAGHPDVLDVEQDQVVRLAGEQVNPPWGLDRIDQREVNIPNQLYRYPNEANDVHAYVLDTGIHGGHPDLRGRVTRGINTVDGGLDTADCHGHGTSVASTLGGTEYGVAKSVQIVSVKVLDCGGSGTDTSIAEGIEYVVRTAERPAVINMSLGVAKDDPRASDIDFAVQAAADAGLVVVASAGNDNRDACLDSPGGTPEVITVGATDDQDRRWVETNLIEGSNWGDCVDLFAPGVDIPTADYLHELGPPAVVTGTSFAAPHVSGVAAMILQTHPTYGAAEVQEALRKAATPGVVQRAETENPLLLFVEQPPTDPPLGLVADANPDGTIALTWLPVLQEGIHYLVSQRDISEGETEFTRWATPVTGLPSAVARGLEEDHYYEFVVQAANSTGIGPESNIAGDVAHTEPPGPPTELTATANDDGTITLEWISPSPSEELWFEIYQRDLTAGETEETKLPLPIFTCCTMTAGYLLHDHEYEFRVTASNRGGEGQPSDPARARSQYPAPAPPTGLTATAGDGEVGLTWTASPSPDVWYWVYQRNVSAGETSATRLPLPVASCCTHTPGYLTNDDEYEFTVTALGQGGESSPSNPVRVTPRKPVPGKVTGLAAQPNPDGTITLTWSEPSGGPHWYEVYQRDVTAGESEYTKIPVPITTCCTFTAGLLTHDHRYEFVVGATNGREGPLSDPVRAVAHYDPPGAPRNLTGIAAGDATIDLDWEPPGAGSFYYWIYQRDVTAGQTGFTRSGLPTDQTSATVGRFVHGHVYEFKVTAENQGGEGPASATVRVTSLGGLPLPPAGLTATAGDSQVTLRWAASPTPDVWYWIEYRARGGSWQRIDIPVTTCCTNTVRHLANGTTYDFRLRATNASGDSVASNVASARPMPPLPQPPTGLSATAGDGQVTLRWTASPSPDAWYWIEYRARGGSWQRIGIPVTTCCANTVRYLTNGTTYDFRVRATNLSGDSAPSNVASARPMPPRPQPPSGLTATAGDGRVALRWAASPTRDVWYWIEYRARGGSWQRIGIPVTTCCANTVRYLTNGTTYDFRVRATNLSGNSAPSNIASARPLPPRPVAPSGLRARAGFNSVDLSWSASPSPNIMYYVYYRNVSRNGAWVKLAYPTSSTWIRVSYLNYAETYAFRVTAANYWYESAFSNTARATTVRGGCSAIAFTPFIREISSDYAEVHGTNSTSCTGVVYNVKVTANLWRQAFTPDWHVAATSEVHWGTVPVSRYGYSTARWFPGGLCTGYITQAVTTWTFANGNPGRSVDYSPTVWLRWGTPGGCTGP